MQNTDMTFSEVVEYTGYNFRKPTPEEIDIILSFAAIKNLQVIQSDEKPLSAEQAKVELDKFIKEQREEVEITSMVIDLMSSGYKVFISHSVRLLLQDHQDYKNAIHPFRADPNNSAFIQAMDRITDPHNHLVFVPVNFIINPNGSVVKADNSFSDICLKVRKEAKS